jgi:hypothetical protein
MGIRIGKPDRSDNAPGIERSNKDMAKSVVNIYSE